MVLVAGELELPFDEIEMLKAMLVVVAPFVPGDKRLKETVDVVGEVMRTPGSTGSRGGRGVDRTGAGCVRAGGEGGAGRVSGGTDGTDAAGGEVLPEAGGDGGGDVARAAAGCGAREGVLPVYLPEAVKNELPMFRRVRLRVVGGGAGAGGSAGGGGGGAQGGSGWEALFG